MYMHVFVYNIYYNLYDTKVALILSWMWPYTLFNNKAK